MKTIQKCAFGFILFFFGLLEAQETSNKPTSIDEYQLELILQGSAREVQEVENAPATIDEYQMEPIFQAEAIEKYREELEEFQEENLGETKELILWKKALEAYQKKNAPKSLQGIKVAILGHSSNEYYPHGLHENVLISLLESIRKKQPQALFFMGNLAWSLGNVEKKNDAIVQIAPQINIFGNVVENDRGVYNSKTFKAQLDFFSKILDRHLGKDIPFYPLMGEDEAIGSDSLKIFTEHFKIKDAEIVNEDQLAYGVAVKNAYFALISTDYFDSKGKISQEHILTDAMLDWLQKKLQGLSSDSHFRFVLGSEPAFSTTAPFGIFGGFDKDEKKRDLFWRTLQKNNVLAYFADNEVLYDRSFRSGVWQIISGGGGASREFIAEDETFYHYLLLTIPEDKALNPILEVYDIKGDKQDELTLSTRPGAIFDYRIFRYPGLSEINPE